MSSAIPVARQIRNHRFWTAVVLLALATAILAERGHTYGEPQENDMAVFAVIGHGLLHGRPLYADWWDNKPPLLHLTYAAGELVAGYGQGGILAINIAAALATLATVYIAGRSVGGRSAGLFAAVLWTLIGGDPMSLANQPNAEVFINPTLTAAFILLTRGQPSWRVGWATGALFAIASLYEQHMIVVAATLAGGYVLAGGRTAAGRRCRAMAVAAGVGAVAWVGLFGYFAAVGRLGPAVDMLLTQNAQYGGNLAANLADGLRPSRLFPAHLAWAAAPAALVVAAIGMRRAAGAAVGPLLPFAGWIAGAWITIALPGRWFPHYYQLWMPPACIAGGWAAARLVAMPGPGASVVHARLGQLVTACLLLVIAGRQLPPYRWSANEWANRKYESSNCNWVEQAYMGRRLAGILRPDESFWNLGQDEPLYFYSGHEPPTGILFMESMLDPRNARFWPRIMGDLQRANPALIVVSFPWDHWLPASAPVMPWVQANYVSAGTNLTCPAYDLLVRRDVADDLRRRLQHAPPAPPFRRQDYASSW